MFKGLWPERVVVAVFANDCENRLVLHGQHRAFIPS